MIQDFDGKRYKLAGVYPTKKQAEDLAEALRKGLCYYARITEHHLTARGTIPHPDDVKIGRCRTFWRVWQRKNPDHPLWRDEKKNRAAKKSRTHAKTCKKLIARLWHPFWQNHPVVVRIGKMHYELDHSQLLYSESSKTVKELRLGKPLFTMEVSENTPDAAMKVIKAYVDSGPIR